MIKSNFTKLVRKIYTGDLHVLSNKYKFICFSSEVLCTLKLKRFRKSAWYFIPLGFIVNVWWVQSISNWRSFIFNFYNINNLKTEASAKTVLSRSLNISCFASEMYSFTMRFHRFNDLQLIKIWRQMSHSIIS